MIEKLAKLIDVKSISTLSMVATFIFLAVTKEVTSEQFMTIFTTVTAFYFGTQATKNQNGG